MYKFPIMLGRGQGVDKIIIDPCTTKAGELKQSSLLRRWRLGGLLGNWLGRWRVCRCTTKAGELERSGLLRRWRLGDVCCFLGQSYTMSSAQQNQGSPELAKSMHGRSSSYLHEENVPSQRAAGWLRPSGHEESPQRRRHSMQRTANLRTKSCKKKI